MKKSDCLFGTCPNIQNEEGVIIMSHGAGGKETQALIAEMRKFLGVANGWKHTDDDGAVKTLTSGKYVFTADSYVVTPIFFPGGNIGKIAFCGTVNDLAVMGGRPLGLSLNLILEEGLSRKELFTIIDTIGGLSRKTKIPVVTGDTKVVERGSVDKIVITTSGIGVAQNVFEKKLTIGDAIIVSGGIGEHGAALLAERFEMETDIVSDSASLWEEVKSVQKYIKQAKDITRGGLASALNELSEKSGKKLFVDDRAIPMQNAVRSITDMLGIDALSLASEGRFVCVVSKKDADRALKILKRFHKDTSVIGAVQKGSGVHVQTRFGTKILPMPSGSIVPRIC